MSALNSCGYCHGIQEATAEAFGVPAGVLEALLADIDTAPVDEPMKPLLRYVTTLTRTPSRMTPALAAGWNDQALHDAVSVCALFNLMNRLVEGLGVSADEAYRPRSAQRLAAGGYGGLKQLLTDIVPQTGPSQSG